MVEVKGVSFQFPSGFRDFFQGKVEQAAVVSFELDGSVFFQNLVVAGKKLPGGKAAGLEVRRRFAWRSFGQGSEKFR